MRRWAGLGFGLLASLASIARRQWSATVCSFIVETADLRSRPSKFRSVKSCAELFRRFRPEKSFDPSSTEEIVNEIGVAPKDFTELLAATRNERDPFGLERYGLALDGILDFRVCQRGLNR